MDASQDGDVLLVRGGSYAGFVITDKALSVVADAGAQVTVANGTRVRDLAPTRTVALIDLGLQGAPSMTDPLVATGLTLTNNSGPVRVERCRLAGAWAPSGSPLSVTTCADVALTACTLSGLGYVGSGCGTTGTPGLTVQGGSVVSLYGCIVQGSNGAQGGCNCDGGFGGPGARVLQSTLFSSNSTFTGGRGGDAVTSAFPAGAYGGDGGDGIFCGQGTVRILDSATAAGSAGRCFDSSCGNWGGDGSPGLARRGSTFVDIAGSARTLSSHAIVHGGTTESFTVRGDPGDLVGLYVSPTTIGSFVPAWHGMLFVPLRPAPAATRLLYLGVVPQSGALEFPLAISTLPPGVQSQTSFIQASLLTTQGQRYLSSVRTLVTLP